MCMLVCAVMIEVSDILLFTKMKVESMISRMSTKWQIEKYFPLHTGLLHVKCYGETENEETQKPDYTENIR